MFLPGRASSSDVNGLPAGPMPTAPGPIAPAGVPVVATPAMPQGVAVKAELVAPPDVNGAFAMPPAKAIQKRRPSLPKEAPSADVSPDSPRAPPAALNKLSVCSSHPFLLCMRACACVCMCVCARVSVCVCVCVFASRAGAGHG